MRDLERSPPRSILYLAFRPPFPPDKGERIRMYHQIRHLASRMAVHLVYPSGDPTRERVGEWAAACASVEVVAAPRFPHVSEARSFISGRPRVLGLFHSARLTAVVERAVQTHAPDVVLASTVHVAPAIRGLVGIPRIVDFMDVYSEVWLGMSRLRPPPFTWTDRWEGRRLAAYESEIAREVDATLVVSQAEARLLKRRIPHAPVVVVPNGVDLEYFRPRPQARESVPPTVAFLGTMEYPPNDDAARHLIEKVVPLIPEAERPRVLVIGRSPSAALRSLVHPPAVEVTGEVPDVRPFLAEASAVAAPFRMGRGVQNKVLEAMAMGIPVVASPLGAEGIEAGLEDGLQVAASDEAFAEAIRALVTAPDEVARRGARARAYVEAHHRWSESGAKLEDALRRAMTGGTGG